MLTPVLKLSDRVSILPIIHGSGDCAVEVRRHLLRHAFDCVAVPLPPSFQGEVERAITHLPMPSLVVQHPPETWGSAWAPDSDEEDDDVSSVTYVPIDPCQGVIAALRFAMGEHIRRAFIDLETVTFETYTQVLPDAYALKKVRLDRFAAAILPSLERPWQRQRRQRIARMAARLRELERRHEAILLVCSVLDWPWIREAYHERTADVEDELGGETIGYQPDAATLLFLLGELPSITGLYERARERLDDDEHLAVDGVKELLVAARESYRRDFQRRARPITPQLLATCLKYTRNLTLLDRRLTPDLYNIVIAAKQIAGDSYALHVAEQAREYPYLRDTPFEPVTLGIDRMRLPTGDIVRHVSRLPGSPIAWRSCQLQPRPDRRQRRQWEMRWNPFSQCSWPPEDKRIEDFRTHVADRARKIMGTDLARTEKFTTSLKDGLDIRDTLRNWHTGDLYVKVLPPDRGRLDAVAMLFDSPADPRDYPWRTTWFAEHQNESTLAFFATNFHEQLVGPGIGLATYGGALFLFPPVAIPDVWTHEALDFCETLEERLLAAACLHSQCPHIALLSTLPPGAGWRRLARRFRKKWVHLPWAGFSQSTVQQLRMVHVLNGHQVRSYAADFIRHA